MGFLDDLKKSFNEATTGLKTQIERYKNQNALEAMMAASAFIASADGHIDASEKRRMAGIVRANSLLAVYNTDEAIAIFNKYVEQFQFDYEVGKAEALRVIGRFRDQPEVARMVVRVAIMIGNSDGNLDEDERRALLDIVREVNENPADFDLGDVVTTTSGKRPDRITLGGARS